MDLNALLSAIATVGFPCVIALLFWRHIDLRERAETEMHGQQNILLARLIDRIDRIDPRP